MTLVVLKVRSEITSVVCQIGVLQRFDFDCNLVVTRKVIIQIPPGLGRNPLYLNLVTSIEVLNVKVGVKKAMTLLLYHTDIKVLKDALAC
jgi:hypothetical protein